MQAADGMEDVHARGEGRALSRPCRELAKGQAMSPEDFSGDFACGGEGAAVFYAP